jgi:hypothetical protein
LKHQQKLCKSLTLFNPTPAGSPFARGNVSIDFERVEFSPDIVDNIFANDINADFITLVITPNNRVLTNISDYLINNTQTFDNWIVVGQSGSITKIITKIKAGFKGVVVIKQGDVFQFNYLSREIKDTVKRVVILGSYQYYLSRAFRQRVNNKFSINNSRMIAVRELLEIAQVNQIRQILSESPR